MTVVDTQLHLPTDQEKGEQIGYHPLIADAWAETVAASFQDKYSEHDEDYAIVPTVTNREYGSEDEFYLAALEDRRVSVPTRAVEIDQGYYSANVIGRYDPSYFGEIDGREQFIDQLLEHGYEYKDESAILLSHPFSEDGGLLRGEDRESELYQNIVEAADQLHIYTDQNSNAWMDAFQDRPWSFLNNVRGDWFGFDYWSLEDDTDGVIRNIGCSDAKDPKLAGQGASYNPDYDELPDLDDLTTFLDDTGTYPFTFPIPARNMIRKIGSAL